MQCINNCSNDIWPAENILINIDEDKFEAIGHLPECPNCGAIARPNILMFGDYNWILSRSNKQQEKFYKWLDYQNENKNKIVIIEIGAGKFIPSIRHLSQSIGRSFNASLIRINPIDADVSDGELSIALNSIEALKKIQNLLLNNF